MHYSSLVPGVAYDANFCVCITFFLLTITSHFIAELTLYQMPTDRTTVAMSQLIDTVREGDSTELMLKNFIANKIHDVKRGEGKGGSCS